MKSIVRRSLEKDINIAVSEVTKDITEAKAFIIITDYDRLEGVSALIKKKYPNAKSIGTSGTTFFNGDCQEEELVIIAFIDGVEVIADVITHLKTTPAASIMEIAKNAEEIRPAKENTVCLEFCTGSEETLVSTFKTGFKLNSHYRDSIIRLIGGTFYSGDDNKTPKVMLNGEIYEDACVYLLIKNLTGRIMIYKENIYGKQNDVTHIATKVDFGNRELIELDHKPAADVYSKELGITKDKIVESVYTNPIGRMIDDDIYIYAQHTLKENGTLLNYKIINEGDELCFLKLMDYDAVNKSTREQILKDIPNPSLIFSVDCAHRYLLYKREDYILTYAKNIASIAPHAGYVSGGEQINNQHMNQTMVCAVFE